MIECLLHFFLLINNEQFLGIILHFLLTYHIEYMNILRVNLVTQVMLGDLVGLILFYLMII